MPAPRARLTPDTTAVLLIDYQIGLLAAVRDVKAAELRRNVGTLAGAARNVGLPVMATTTACDDAWGPLILELEYPLRGVKIINRPAANPWDCPEFVDVVTASRRKFLIIAGLGFDMSVTLLAISVSRQGYHPLVAIDACGTFSAAKRNNGLERLTTLGIELCDCASPFAEMSNIQSASHSHSQGADK